MSSEGNITGNQIIMLIRGLLHVLCLQTNNKTFNEMVLIDMAELQREVYLKILKHRIDWGVGVKAKNHCGYYLLYTCNTTSSNKDIYRYVQFLGSDIHCGVENVYPGKAS